MLSEQLLIDRAGNFTASENHKLMAGWEKEVPSDNFPEFRDLYRYIKPMHEKGEVKYLVGDIQPIMPNIKVTGKLIADTLKIVKAETPPTGLVTYAQEKAIEELFDPDPSLNFETIAMRNGNERELDCMYELAKATGLVFTSIGDQQAHIHADEIGCTPDGIVLDDLDLVKTGAEVKCKSPLAHARNLLINDNDDLKEQAFDHFVQIQTAMLVTGASQWYFANYNPYAKRADLKFKYIIINRDDAFIKILKQRIEIAKQIKADFLKNFQEQQPELKKAA